MIVSLNEIVALTLKACRGGGMSWGLAEEAGRAARWLAGHGLAWERSLVVRLERGHLISTPSLSNREIRPSEKGGALCPVHVGAAISDLLSLESSLMLHDIIESMWVLPFADRRARAGGRVVLSWDGGAIELDAARPNLASALAEALPRGLLVDRIDRMQAAMHPGGAPQRGMSPAGKPAVGIEVDAIAWGRLEGWAARTHVPASRQSRLSGAGATLSDND